MCDETTSVTEGLHGAERGLILARPALWQGVLGPAARVCWRSPGRRVRHVARVCLPACSLCLHRAGG